MENEISVEGHRETWKRQKPVRRERAARLSHYQSLQHWFWLLCFQRIRNLVRSGDFPSTRKKVKNSSVLMPALQHEGAGISSWILCQLLYSCLQYQSHLFPSSVLGHNSCWCKPELSLRRQRYLTADSCWLSSYRGHLTVSVSIMVTQQANLEPCRTGSVELFYNTPALLQICCTPFGVHHQLIGINCLFWDCFRKEGFYQQKHLGGIPVFSF